MDKDGLGIPYEDLPFAMKGDAPMPELQEAISWGDSLSSSWTTEAPAGAMWSQATNRIPPASPENQRLYESGEFNPLEVVAEFYPDLDNELLHEFFADKQSREQIDWQASKLMEEIEAKRIAAAAPGLQQFITDVGVSIIASPTTYAEGAWAVASRNPLVFGAKLASRGAQRAAQFSGMAMVGTALDEFILQQDQAMRSKGVTAMSIAGAGVLGGALGWATGRELVKLNPDLSADIASETVPSAMSGVSTTGAAKRLDDISQDDYNAIVNNPDLTDAEKFIAINEKQAENYEVVGGFLGIGKKAIQAAGALRLNPETTLAVAASPIMRRFGAIMTNAPYLRKGQKAGEGFQNLDAVARRGDTDIEVNIPRIFNKQYNDYKKTVAKPDQMSFLDFQMEVQLSVTRGHISDNPFARAAGVEIDERFLTPLGIRGTRAGSLKAGDDGKPVAPLGDEKWWLRGYSRSFALRATPDEYAEGLIAPYMNRLRKQVGEEKADIEAKITKMREDLAAQGKKLDAKEAAAIRRKNPKARALKRLEKNDAPLRKRFTDMQASIRRGGDSMQNGDYSGFGLRLDENGLLKTSEARTLDVATEDIPRDYLDPDSMMSIVNTLKRMNRQMLVVEDPRFDGDPTFGTWRAAREKEHNARLEGIKRNSKSETARKKAEKKEVARYTRDLDYINKLGMSYYQIRPDTPSEWMAAAMSNFRAFNALTGLGSVLFSTVPELGAALSHNGVRGYVDLATAWISDPKLMKEMTNVQKAEFDIGIQTNMGNRISEVGEYADGMGKASRMLHKTADVAVDRVYMLGTWTRGISTQMGFMTTSKLGRLMMKKNLSARDIEDLGRLGVTNDMHEQLRKEITNNHHKFPGGAIDIGITKWDNKALAQDVMNIVNAEVDNVIIRPGVGATPFVGRTMLGATMLQFKQFLLAATSKYLVSDIQRVAMGDFRAIERQLAFLALGTLSMHLKNEYLYGESASKRWAKKDITEKMWDGLSAGGGAGLGGDVANTVMEIAHPGSGSSRFYGQRSWQGMIGGPTVSKAFEDVPAFIRMGGQITGSDIEFSNADAKAIWRNLPGNSFWPVRMGFSQTTGKGGNEILYEAIE